MEFLSTSRTPLIHPLSSRVGPLQRLNRIPVLMVAIVVILSMIGVMTLYSAAGGDWSPWAGKHLVRLGIGMVLMVMVAMVPISSYRKVAPLAWVAAVIVLGLLEFIGGGKGVERWLSIGGFNIQPSEPAKLAIIMVLAAYFHTINQELIRNIRTYIPVAVIILLPFAQVIFQPDLGTALMMIGSAAAVVFVAGIPTWMIAAIFGLTVAAIPVVWSFLYEYQKSRILVFLNPETDQLGAGYQIAQSKIALGSGGLLGKGYLQGSQARLNYLPEKQTDFIFTVIGEEFGFLGCLIVMAFYVSLVGLLLLLGLQLQYRFSRLLIVGIATMLFLFIFVNVAMVTGLIPVVGAPLPLVSYGGTALMTVFIAIGLVISAVIYDHEDDY